LRVSLGWNFYSDGESHCRIDLDWGQYVFAEFWGATFSEIASLGYSCFVCSDSVDYCVGRWMGNPKELTRPYRLPSRRSGVFYFADHSFLGGRDCSVRDSTVTWCSLVRREALVGTTIESLSLSFPRSSVTPFNKPPFAARIAFSQI
jgi:hypothetical protein